MIWTRAVTKSIVILNLFRNLYAICSVDVEKNQHDIIIGQPYFARRQGFEKQAKTVRNLLCCVEWAVVELWKAAHILLKNRSLRKKV